MVSFGNQFLIKKESALGNPIDKGWINQNIKYNTYLIFWVIYILGFIYIYA